MTLRDVIISAFLLTALPLLSCQKSDSVSEEVRCDTRDEIISSLSGNSESDTVRNITEETSGNVFKAETWIPGFPYEMVDTPQVYPHLNDKTFYWQEPDGKYTYKFSFRNISNRTVEIEQVEFESDPADSAIVKFCPEKLEPGTLTFVPIKVAKPYPKGFRHITFYLKGQETPEVHTMEVLEKMPIPDN